MTQGEDDSRIRVSALPVLFGDKYGTGNADRNLWAEVAEEVI
jgi:hypothetical protein